MESDAYRRLKAQREAARGARPVPAQPTPKIPSPARPRPQEARPAKPAHHTIIAEFPPIEKDLPRNDRKKRDPKEKSKNNSAYWAALIALDLAGIAGLASHHLSNRSRSYDYETRTERVEVGPVEVHGFERAPFGAPTNEEITEVERSVLPAQYHIPIQQVIVGDAPRPMPPEYGIAGNEDAHCDTGRREIVIGPQVLVGLSRQTGEWIYNSLLLHEDGHAFNWNSAPNLTREQRDLYRMTFVRHLQDGTPRIRSSYVDAIHNADPAQEWEFKAVEYQAELVQAILSLHFPEYRTGTWDEAVAQKIHEIHQIPLDNARYEVRLFRWMIELTFPGRSPEAMHREVQASIQRTVERGSYRINTATLHQHLSPELQAITDQAFLLPPSENWLRQYSQESPNQPSSRRHPSPRQELLQQQASRTGQIWHEIDRRSEHVSQVREFFLRADTIGRWFHQNHASSEAAVGLQSAYSRLSRHDRQVVQYYLPTYGQLLQFKPSLYHVTPAVAQAAHAHAI